MGASGGEYVSADAAAEAYAAELAAAAGPEDHGPVPTFDVLLLGVGPDAHVASLFPEYPGVRESVRTVVGVHGSPKPPPTRVSLTLRRFGRRGKCGCSRRARTRPGRWRSRCRRRVSCRRRLSGAYGRARTLWLLDAAAAAHLPPQLYPPSSS